MSMEQFYKGDRFCISTDGVTAEKTDGKTSRQMKYYSERDIVAIAGEIDELTAWKILRDVALQASKSSTPISPSHVFIDGTGFVLSEWSESLDQRFVAPEGYSEAWALAATVFYVFLGCHVFQGLGGRGQTPASPIPVLRKNLGELSSLIVSCLDFKPAKRPTLAEIADIAEKNIERCNGIKNELPRKDIYNHNKVTADEIDSFWPEEMC